MNSLHLTISRSLRLASLCMLATTLFPLTLGATEVVFQQGHNQYNGASDTTLYGQREDQRSLNYGGKEVLEIAGVRHGGMKRLGLIQFGDLAGIKGIPSGAKVKKATLRLYQIGRPADDGQYNKVLQRDRVIRIHPVLKPWKAGMQPGAMEDGPATYSYREHQQDNPQFWGDSNQIEEGPVPGIDFDIKRSASAPLVSDINVWIEWDVTPIVQGWITDPSTNHGFFLTALSYYVGAYFASSDAQDLSLRPQLVIEY